MMHSTNTFIVSGRFVRCICTSTVHHNRLFKQGRTISKILHKDRPKKAWYKSSHASGLQSNFNWQQGSVGSNKETNSLSGHTTRRMAVLNKVFMEHITDLMGTGEVCPQILNRNIEILNVNVTPDFRTINIHWSDNSIHSPKYAEETQRLLQECAYPLRHALTQLRVITYVPIIQFIRDKYSSQMKEVLAALSTADYGEDYEPSTYVYFPDPRTIDPKSILPSKALSTDTESNLTNGLDILAPAMKHDVLGLDHAKIMSKIKTSLSKARQTVEMRMHQVVDPGIDVSARDRVTEYITQKEQDKLFMKYLKDKRIEKLKKVKALKASAQEMVEEEDEEETDYDDYEDDEDDYYSSDDCHNKDFEDSDKKFNDR